jgi:hypothetical protein
MEKCQFYFYSSLEVFSIFLSHYIDLGVLSIKALIRTTMYTSFSITLRYSILQILYSLLRTLLSLVLIRNLGMKSDYVLFRNSCSSNLRPFGNQTCCQSMKNLKKRLGLSFEHFSFACKIPSLSQLEQ